MKKTLLVLILLGLAGCSSISELRTRGPDQTFESQKSAKAVSECILFGWQKMNIRYGVINIQPYGDGFTVFSAENIEVADITTTASGSSIKFYEQAGTLQYRTNLSTGVIKSCI
ncbi:hypothetical protein [Edaphovirga cremea]|uniref:hypothetical protein n=1 Tax=Edaphovirga cremea TaxID=2267246 RepID=UPI000DEFD972|nr:hypothetical protein [Edaphovirga cremea]